MQSRAGYVLAALLLLAGMAAAGWFVWSGLAGLQNALIRVVVPGSSVLALDLPGTYTIFHEPESTIDGRLYVSENINGLRVGVKEEASGEQITVSAPTVSSRYTLGGHSGVSVLAFDIARSGRYRLDAAYPGGRDEPVGVLAIGREFVWRLLGSIFAAVGCGLAGFGAALALVLTTYFRRRRMRRTAMAG